MNDTYATLRIDLRESVLHLTLNRPESRNAMNLQMVGELQAVFAEVAMTKKIRAIVLRGENGHFCAGGDIRDMAEARTKQFEDNNAYFHLNRQFGEMLIHARQCPALLITVLEGAVLGGGLGLACVSDVAIAHQEAQFGLPETTLGVIPAQIAPFVVQRIGLTQARRLALLGLRITAEEAVRLGIAHVLAKNYADLEQQLASVLSQTKKCAPQANRMTKALLLRVEHEPLDLLLQDAAKQFATAVTGEEAQEGTLAFLQKRPPAWAQ